MKMDIGSIYPLYEEDFIKHSNIKISENNLRLHYSLCRESLYVIAEKYETTNKVVLLPAYTCNTVYIPFKQLGWTCIYYSIRKSLRIDTQSIQKLYNQYRPSVVIAHPYFGMDFNEDEVSVLESIKSEECVLVVDITQCIFSQVRLKFVDYYIGSYRKWFPIPDGGFIETYAYNISDLEEPKAENDIFVATEKAAMFLRGCYFNNSNQLYKDISRSLSGIADQYSIEYIRPHRMSEFSLSILENENYENNIQQRIENYTYLYNHVHNNKVELVCKDLKEVTTAPLYFVIYTNKRKELQQKFISERIYAPIIWPVEDGEVIVDDIVKTIYDTILAIPIDQRYTIEDMCKIVSIINEF